MINHAPPNFLKEIPIIIPFLSALAVALIMGDLGSVVVIGGCGLLGHHVVQRLLDSNAATLITVLDVSTSQNRIVNPKVRYTTGSIASRAETLTALRTAQAKVIINTASPDPLHPVPQVLKDVNITGTQNVLDCAIELGIKIHVYTSSSEVVQHAYDDIIWANETWPLPEHPVNGSVYSRSKQIGEELVLSANGKNGLRTAALRPCTIFGEGDRVLTKHCIDMVNDGRAKFHVGTGRNLYDFVYAGNAADAHILCAKKLLAESESEMPVPEDLRVSGEAFFITNGDPWPFWEFSRAVAMELGKPIADKEIWTIPLGVVCFFAVVVEWVTWVVTAGGRPSITADMLKYTAEVRTFDIGKSKKRLGYEPRVGIEEGVKRAVAWHLVNSAKTEN
ncbi:putative sterol-4-alpha-carboxylate 3-dehydrogenase, decarboxylating [Clohesyomyces aquaticus]|uniref:Putative sterol-4-alpha-carboxylate 3-dehydrogenase, decarboxylating n=1 Tax=Clohesyomyces aquaticus TaxID=1231657 RepID=A0A1Y1Y7X0_9PLEO|nr:putative sterol-4-alpha-carboxylate 3-dehydrogenase, decarboxylating [Clohesyomyces aquaticus]